MHFIENEEFYFYLPHLKYTFIKRWKCQKFTDDWCQVIQYGIQTFGSDKLKTAQNVHNLILYLKICQNVWNTRNKNLALNG